MSDPTTRDQTTRDKDRSQVYAAEDLSAELTILVDPRPIEQLQQIAINLCASPWWSENFDSTAVEVVSNRSEQRSYFKASTRTISLSPRAQDLNTLVHELAHVGCADLGDVGPVHGARFRGVHVCLRAAVAGDRSGADLREVYGQFGLTVDVPSGLKPMGQPPVLRCEVYDAVRIVGRPDSVGKPGPHSGPIAL